jgi:hypothetical protein
MYMPIVDHGVSYLRNTLGSLSNLSCNSIIEKERCNPSFMLGFSTSDFLGKQCFYCGYVFLSQ